jgi:hypothetical protein
MHAGRLSQRDTSEEVQYRHTQTPMSHQQTASKLIKQFRATGSVADKKNGGPRSSADLYHNACQKRVHRFASIKAKNGPRNKIQERLLHAFNP